MARKTIMDEALRRFNYLNKPKGIITNYDADCTCDENYLNAIEELFIEDPSTSGCSIYFEHPIQGNKYEKNVYEAIIQYELYLRYYIEALRIAKFPYAFHTIGSAFAVRAETYARQGGMNQRKAGEDFYFLHKIIPQGNFKELNNTCIYPSPRPSDRVPFGTGIAVTKLLESESLQLLTFNPEAFHTLHRLFELAPTLFRLSESKTEEILNEFNTSLRKFLIRNNFQKSILEFNDNCASIQPFLKRFFNWFNGLLVLQYLNESHSEEFVKVPIAEAAAQILSENNYANIPEKAIDLLYEFRNIQKKNSWHLK